MIMIIIENINYKNKRYIIINIHKKTYECLNIDDIKNAIYNPVLIKKTDAKASVFFMERVTRLVCILLRKIMVRLGQALAGSAHPRCIYIFKSGHPVSPKRKRTPIGVRFLFGGTGQI